MNKRLKKILAITSIFVMCVSLISPPQISFAQGDDTTDEVTSEEITSEEVTSESDVKEISTNVDITETEEVTTEEVSEDTTEVSTDVSEETTEEVITEEETTEVSTEEITTVEDTTETPVAETMINGTDVTIEIVKVGDKVVIENFAPNKKVDFPFADVKKDDVIRIRVNGEEYDLDTNGYFATKKFTSVAIKSDGNTYYLEFSNDKETVSTATPVVTETASTFDEAIAGVSTADLNFSSKELLIGTENPKVFTADTEVVSELNGVYLVRFDTVEHTKNAYIYYYNKVDLISTNETVVKVADEENVADLSDLNNGNDALSKVDDINVSAKGMIALIDTGSKTADKSVSVLSSSDDDNGHGTKMTDIIKEVNPSAKVLSIKALGADGKGKTADIYAAIELAIESKVSIINLSISAISTKDNEIIIDAVKDALNAGIKVVASAGNDGKNAKYYTPGNIDGVITVGAVNKDGKVIANSNSGSCVDYYVNADSTSIAAAYYTGLISAGKTAKDDNRVFTADEVTTDDVKEQSKDELLIGDTDPNDGVLYVGPEGEFTAQDVNAYNAAKAECTNGSFDSAMKNIANWIAAEFAPSGKLNSYLGKDYTWGFQTDASDKNIDNKTNFSLAPYRGFTRNGKIEYKKYYDIYPNGHTFQPYEETTSFGWDKQRAMHYLFVKMSLKIGSTTRNYTVEAECQDAGVRGMEGAANYKWILSATLEGKPKTTTNTSTGVKTTTYHYKLALSGTCPGHQNYLSEAEFDVKTTTPPDEEYYETYITLHKYVPEDYSVEGATYNVYHQLEGGETFADGKDKRLMATYKLGADGWPVDIELSSDAKAGSVYATYSVKNRKVDGKNRLALKVFTKKPTGTGDAAKHSLFNQPHIVIEEVSSYGHGQADYHANYQINTGFSAKNDLNFARVDANAPADTNSTVLVLTGTGDPTLTNTSGYVANRSNKDTVLRVDQKGKLADTINTHIAYAYKVDTTSKTPLPGATLRFSWYSFKNNGNAGEPVLNTIDAVTTNATGAQIGGGFAPLAPSTAPACLVAGTYKGIAAVLVNGTPYLDEAGTQVGVSVQEIGAPYGYQVESGTTYAGLWDAKRAVDRHTNDNPVLTNTYPKLAVLKKSADGVTPLAGAEFALYKASDGTQVGGIASTNANGYGGFWHLSNSTTPKYYDDAGYYLVETKAPEGYQLMTPNPLFISMDSIRNPAKTYKAGTNTYAVVEVTDPQATGSKVKITKSTEQNNAVLNATFGVYYSTNVNEDINTGSFTKIDEKTTVYTNSPKNTETGFEYSYTKAGCYYLKELVAPEGYLLNDNKFAFKITWKAKTTTVSVPNVGNVNVTDWDPQFNQIAGAWTTDGSMWQTKVIDTSYTGKFSLQKSYKGGNKDLAGCEFTVYCNENVTVKTGSGITDVKAYTKGEEIGKITTDVNGYAESMNLYATRATGAQTGVKYFIKETKGNMFYGLPISNTGIEVIVHEGDSVNDNKIVYSDPNIAYGGGVRIYKIDKDTGLNQPAPGTNFDGITYGIYAAYKADATHPLIAYKGKDNWNESNPIDNEKEHQVLIETIKIKPGETYAELPFTAGESHIAENLSVGEYYIQEIAGNDYYENTDPNKYYFTLSVANGNVVTYDYNANDYNTNKIVKLTQTIGNTRKLGTVKIQKKDAETGKTIPQTGKTFEGIEYTIYLSSSNGKVIEYDGVTYNPGDAITKIYADALGVAEISVLSSRDKMLPVGKYYIEETKGNADYDLGDEKGKMYNFEIKNEGDRAEFVQDKGNSLNRGAIDLTKIEDYLEGTRGLKNIPFVLTNETTGERHIIISGIGGAYSTETIAHSNNTNNNDNLLADVDAGTVIKDTDIKKAGGTWFGIYDEGGVSTPVTPIDDAMALTIGNYTLEEVMSESTLHYQGKLAGGADQKLFKKTGIVVTAGNTTTVDSAEGKIVNTPVAPSVRSLALGKNTKLHMTEFGANSPIVETVTFDHLAVNHEYKLVSKLIDKADGTVATIKNASDEDEEIIKETTFTCDYADIITDAMTGEIRTTKEFDVEFNVDSEQLKGRTFVVYEYLYDATLANIRGVDELLVASEEDIDNANQRIKAPKVTTKAYDFYTKDNQGTYTKLGENDFSLAKGEIKVKITDNIQMDNFVDGKQYTIKGEVLDLDDLSVLANNEIKVTPDSEVSYLAKMDFEFKTALKGDGNNFLIKQEVYYHEPVADKDVLIFLHYDTTDEDEMINLINAYSKAEDVNTGTHQGAVGKDTILTDMVELVNLLPGYDYEVTNYAVMLDDEKKTESTDPAEVVAYKGKEIPYEKEVEGLKQTKTITANHRNEKVRFEYTIDTSNFAGKTIVFCAEIRHAGTLVGTHYDLSNKDQTIRFPKVWTEAKDVKTLSNISSWDKTQFVDTVHYENVVIGQKQKVTGILMDKATNEYLGKDLDKPENTAESVEFVPDKSEGTIDVTYEVDSSLYEGKTSVCFEDLVVNNKVCASHRDINDVGQTIKLAKERTHAHWISDEVKSKAALRKTEPVHLEDRVDYWNLDTTKEYTQTATLMNAETGEPILMNGAPVVSSVTFIPETPDGYVLVPFDITTEELAGTTINIFEDLYWNNIKVCAHADLTDTTQNVYVPRIRTKAWSEATKNEVLEVGVVNDEVKKYVMFDDEIMIENVPEGRYRVNTIVIDKETGEAIPDVKMAVVGHTKELIKREGYPMYSEYMYKDITKDMDSITVRLQVDTTLYEGKTFVIFEELYEVSTPDLPEERNTLIAEHKDLDDTSQTVHIPKIHTTFTDGLTFDHIALADEKVTQTDVVTYTNLVPGKEYTMTGTLMVKGTKKPLMDDEGNPITATKTFTPEEPDGKVDIVFTYDASLLRGETVVAFEKLFHEGIEVEAHEDIDDEGQTIRFPKIGTRAANFITGEKTIEPDEKSVIVDTIDYSNFPEYGADVKVIGKVVVKSTEEVVAENSKEYEVKDSGDIEMQFELDTRKYEGEKLVVFEYVYDSDDHLIAIHEDLDDDGQTVTVLTTHPKTGDIPMIPIGLSLLLAGAGIIFIGLRKKNK